MLLLNFINYIHRFTYDVLCITKVFFHPVLVKCADWHQKLAAHLPKFHEGKNL